MKPNKLELCSVNGTQLNLEALYQIAPSCFTEVKDDKTGELRHVVNFKTLRQLLGDNAVEDADEMYQFTWPGKQEARREAARPTTKTLRPVVEDSVDWDNTQNLYIEGDNLEVLKLLQKSYMGKVKMIYIDPPYNTGNDFVYDDDFAISQDDYDLFAGNIDELGYRYRKNTDSNGRFHSDWCSMMYSRLMVARSLLTEDGVIFISIDDNEQRNLKNICDEIFGENNQIGVFIINSTPNARDYGHIGKMHEFALCYAKNILFTNTNLLPDNNKEFAYKDSISGFNIHPLYNSNEAFTNVNRPNLYYPFFVYINEPISDSFYKIGLEEKENSVKIYPPKSLKNGVQFVWRWGKEKAIKYMNSEIIAYEIKPNEYRIVQKMRHDEKLIRSLLIDTKYSSRRGTAEVENILGGKFFSFPKPLSLISDFTRVGLDHDSLILDFFSGSATTAHAVMQLNAEDGGNRKYIMVQLPEETPEDSEARKAGYNTIPEIAKERIRRAGKKIKEENKDKEGIETLDTGFRVFRLADSNFEEVKKAPMEYDQSQLDLFLNNVKSDRTDLDLLFGAMLSWGVQLSLPMTSEEVDGKMIYSVNDGDLVACFADDITENIVKAMADKQPLRVLFRDSCFARDDAKINVFETLKQLLDWSEEEAIKNIKVI